MKINYRKDKMLDQTIEVKKNDDDGLWRWAFMNSFLIGKNLA